MEPSTRRTAMSVRRLNSAIRNKVVDMYKQFVSEVDPKDVLDLLIQKRIIPIERKEEVMNHRTRQERCRALLDQLFICSHKEAFIFLREAINEHYHWIVESIDASETEEDGGGGGGGGGDDDGVTGTRRTAVAGNNVDLEVKLKAAEKRIAELELEVVRYKNQTDELLRELLRSSCDAGKPSPEDDVDAPDYETIRPVSDQRIKPIKTGGVAVSSATAASEDSPSLPSLPPGRPKVTTEARAEVKDNGFCTASPVCLSFLNTINGGSAAVRGMATLDSILFVVRFGSATVEIYDGKERFKKSKKTISIVTPPELKDKLRFHRRKRTDKKTRSSSSSGIQDIAGCHLNRCLYVSDWQNRCVHCVSPVKREVVRCWTVEAGEPWGLSVTEDGTVVVSVGDSGELCEYTGDGTLLRTVALSMVEEGPWHGFPSGNDAWIFCHGERYGTGGFVSVADREGNYFGGGGRDRQLLMHGPSHLALLPDNRVLVAESEKNRVVVLDQSLLGPVREILNPDDGVTMPVRLHYCRSSHLLFVGLHNGSISIYQMKSAVTAPSTSVSQC